MKLPCNRCGRVGASWCARADCPLYPKMDIPVPKQQFAGVAPNLFIGSHGYPDVRVGVLATEDHAGNDDPRSWTAAKTPIPTIITQRAGLVNSTVRGNVHSFAERYAELQGLVAQSERPVAIDVDLTKKPTFAMQFPAMSAPYGPSVELRKAELTENVHVPTDVESVLADELRTSEQITLLTRKHDNYYLQKLFAAGLFGQDRKLVPTRWSITAVDDTIGKQHLEKIHEFPIVSEPRVYTGGHYGNEYCIVILPHRLQYELFELMVGSRAQEGKSIWTDYEGFEGRKEYASDTVGGYYAARLSITEALLTHKRQGTVLVFRFVTDEYTHPLGVWVVREAVRIAMSAKPLTFASDELALAYLRAYAKKRHQTDIGKHLQQSKLLSALRQRSLGEY